MHAINVALTSMVINPWFDRSRRASENWSGAIKCDARERGDASRGEQRRCLQGWAPPFVSVMTRVNGFYVGCERKVGQKVSRPK